jgi:hypothetical protein
MKVGVFLAIGVIMALKTFGQALEHGTETVSYVIIQPSDVKRGNEFTINVAFSVPNGMYTHQPETMHPRA